MQEWLVDHSSGRPNAWRTSASARACPTLAVPIAYQLLHRTASAIIEAQRFKTDEAAMIVHSFSKTGTGFKDFGMFAGLFGLTAAPDRLLTCMSPSGLPLHIAWATGDTASPHPIGRATKLARREDSSVG